MDGLSLSLSLSANSVAPAIPNGWHTHYTQMNMRGKSMLLLPHVKRGGTLLDFVVLLTSWEIASACIAPLWPGINEVLEKKFTNPIIKSSTPVHNFTYQKCLAQ